MDARGISRHDHGFLNERGYSVSTVTIERRAHVIVLGNEKGGSGKSTAGMPLIVGLLRDGHRVGALDLDARQATLGQYVAARQAFAQARGGDLPLPQFAAVERSTLDSRAEAEADETSRFSAAIAEMAECDVIVLDCPGADTFLSRLGH